MSGPLKGVDTAALSRRGFVIATAAAGAVFGFAGETAAAVGEAHAGYEPTLWYAIAPDGVVTVNVKYAEMGQHVGTALARIVAEELEADWSAVRVVYVDSDPKWGQMSTGGSYSVFGEYPELSQAGTAGRIALIEAGARLLGVDPAACVARRGQVRAVERAVSYGDIVRLGKPSRVFTADALAKLPLKPATGRRIIGSPGAALDIPDKVNGRALYGIDAKREGMLFGRPVLPPVRFGCKVAAIDDAAARAIPGYVKTVALDDPNGFVSGWVVVLAKTYPTAMKAARAVKVSWTGGRNADVSEARILDFGRKLIADPVAGGFVRDDPGLAEAFAKASRTLEAEYTTATVLHFALEPVNALAWREADGHWEVLTGNQWQSLALPWLEKAAGVASGQVTMRTHLLGGGFGRRLMGDYAIAAVLAAKAADAPVKLLAERAEDSRGGTPRSPSVQRLRAALAGKTVAAMEHAAAAGWPNAVMSQDSLVDGVNKVKFDPDAIHGAEHWYGFGPQRLRGLNNTLASETIIPGWLRSVSASWTNWAVESFIDEMAHALGEDPLAFRLRHLIAEGRNAGESPQSVGGAARQVAVLNKVAGLAGYGKPLPVDTAIGIACTHGQSRDEPTWCAGAARVHVDRKTGLVTCQRLDIVVDCGSVIHPDGALAQAQGGALWGLSMALHEGTEIMDGQVKDHNLGAYPLLRMADVPEVNIAFVDTGATPTGLGEPPVTVVAPAIGNAIFNAVGARVRHLPIRPAAVLAGLRAGQG